MKLEMIALPLYQARVSPLLDLSENFIIVEVNDGSKSDGEEVTLEWNNDLNRYDKLLNFGIDVIICNAISRLHLKYFCSKKIKVINGIIGEIDDVIDAYCDNRLTDFCLSLSPCKKRRGQCSRSKED